MVVRSINNALYEYIILKIIQWWFISAAAFGTRLDRATGVQESIQENGRGMNGVGSTGKGWMAGGTGMENRGNSRKSMC